MTPPRVVRLAGREFRVVFVRDQPGRLFAEVESSEGRRRLEIGSAHDGGLLVDGEPLEYRLERHRDATLTLHAGGESWRVEVLSETEAALRGSPGQGGARAAGAVAVYAPMPGRLLAVEIAEGEAVESGRGLFIIEAMKMENEIRAPRAGRVRNLRVAEGDAVEGDQRLCEIHPLEPSLGSNEEAAGPAGSRGLDEG